MLGCVFFSGGLWGIAPALSRIAIDEGGHPIGLTLWQGLGGGALLFLLVRLSGRRLPLAPKRLLLYAVCGLTGTAIPTSLTFATTQHLPVGIIALALATVPMLTYAIAIGARLDSLVPIRVSGVVLGFVAVCLLVVPDTGLPASVSLAWMLAAMVIPLLYAAENNIIAVFRPANLDGLSLLCGMLICGGIATIPAVWITDGFTPLQYPFRTMEWVTFGLIAVNIFSYGTFLYVIRAAGPVFAAQAGYFSMLTGVLSGMVMFDERHSAWVWVALGLIVVGMTLVKEQPRPDLIPAPRPGTRESSGSR